MDTDENADEVFLKKTKNSVKITKNDKNSETTPKKDFEKWELVPPDGGWGWLVLMGAMLVNILIPGTIKSFGVLFVEFLEAFEASPVTASWIPALCYFLYSSLGPLSSILSVKYSYKTVTIIGGTFAAVGMIFSFWATSVTYLYVSYGVMVGIGAGLSFPPTVYIVTSYFLRLRGLANGLCISGSALGSIILPPVLRYLLETFGYRGAVLIMGGVTLNVWVAALFYHPVEQHLIRVPIKDDEFIEEELAEIEEGDENNVNELENSRPKFMITSDEHLASNPKLNNKSQSPDIFNYPNSDNGFVRSASAAVVQNLSRDRSSSIHRKISVPLKEGHRNNSATNQLSSTSSLYAIPENRYSFLRLNKFKQSEGGPPKRSPSTSSFQYISTPYHGSTLAAIQPSEFASHLSLKSITNSFNPVSACTKGGSDDGKKESNMSKFFDLTLLKDPTYLVILISNSTNAISYTNFIILLPSYAIAMGFDKSKAAYLLSIVSTLDLIGRIGGSALSDIELIPKSWYFVGGLAVSGVSLATLSLAKTYTTLSLCCSFFGLASGIYVGITAVIMADMLGTERLTSSYGISLFVNGILQLIGPPICGVWYESSKTYAPLFTTLGFILLGGSALWGFMPFIDRHNRNKLAKEMTKDNNINVIS